jgi:ribosomal protein L16 Arg81 hydroxylase
MRNTPSIKTSSKIGNSLSDRFWTRFAKKEWEKRPLILKHPFATPLITTSQLFSAMIAAREELGRCEKRHLRFFVDDEIHFAHVKRHLPRPADRSLHAYRKRITESVRGARFGLVVVDYPSFDAELCKRVRKFLRPLRELIDSGVKSKTLLFMGDYERTPVGIHQDPHGTFVFVIEGRKRFRAWPGDYFPDAEKTTGRLRYRQFLADAVTLEGAAGDLIYWPSSYWHIGEPVGGFSVTLNVGVFGAVPEL